MMDLQERESEDERWIQLFQDRVMWRAHVGMI
jgi:hypothetical protein